MLNKNVEKLNIQLTHPQSALSTKEKHAYVLMISQTMFFSNNVKAERVHVDLIKV